MRKRNMQLTDLLTVTGVFIVLEALSLLLALQLVEEAAFPKGASFEVAFGTSREVGRVERGRGREDASEREERGSDSKEAHCGLYVLGRGGVVKWNRVWGLDRKVGGWRRNGRRVGGVIYPSERPDEADASIVTTCAANRRPASSRLEAQDDGADCERKCKKGVITRWTFPS